jgi:ubiquinone biosynthesis protein UbiJ
MIRVAAAFKGQPPLEGNLGVDLRVARVFIGANNSVRLAADTEKSFDCTITLGLDTLTKFETANDFERAIMLADGDVDVQGDSGLAEKFAGILRSAA